MTLEQAQLGFVTGVLALSVDAARQFFRGPALMGGVVIGEGHTHYGDRCVPVAVILAVGDDAIAEVNKIQIHLQAEGAARGNPFKS